MKLDYVFQSFDGKLIDQIRVDTQDRVFVRIGHIVSTEDYAKGELVYVGQFKERPVYVVNSILSSLQLEFHNLLIKNLKRKFKTSQCIKIREGKFYDNKKAKVTPSLSKIEDFLYSDLIFYKTRLYVSYDQLKRIPISQLKDLEKYPAGYARYIIQRLINNGNSYNDIIKEAPAAIKRL